MQPWCIVLFGSTPRPDFTLLPLLAVTNRSTGRRARRGSWIAGRLQEPSRTRAPAPLSERVKLQSERHAQGPEDHAPEVIKPIGGKTSERREQIVEGDCVDKRETENVRVKNKRRRKQTASNIRPVDLTRKARANERRLGAGATPTATTACASFGEFSRASPVREL